MRKDYKKLMVIGSGPIVIGQAAEFDFSGSQACRSLREEGYKTILVNSNPATIQTDPETADKVYIEPMQADMVAKIIEKEGVDGIVSGMGGQTEQHRYVRSQRLARSRGGHYAAVHRRRCSGNRLLLYPEGGSLI